MIFFQIFKNNSYFCKMEKQILKNIADELMRQGITIPESGLLHGKMGLVIFFFHYARYTDNKSFEDYAMELMDSIQEQIIQQHVLNYATGLAGIGAGIEYLAQHNFVEVDENETFEYLDSSILGIATIGSRNDVSLFTGLSGFGRYFLFRVARHYKEDEHIGILNNKMMLTQIVDIFERLHPFLKESQIEDVLMFLYAMNQTAIFPVKVKRMIQLFSSDESSSNQENVMCQYGRKIDALYNSRYNELVPKFTPDFAPDLYGGLAGIGLYLLSKLDKRHETWMKLL